MKNIFFTTFLLCILQPAFASSIVKDLERKINSVEFSMGKENFKNIDDYITKNNILFEQLSTIKVAPSKNIYLDFAKGVSLYRKNKFNESLSYFYEIYYKIHDAEIHDDFLVLLRFLKDTESALGNSKNAEFLLNKLYAASVKLKKYDYIHYCLIEYGVSVRNNRNYTKALKLFSKAQNIEKKIGKVTDFDWLNLHIGDTYIRIAIKENPINKSKYFKKAKYHFDLCYNKTKPTDSEILFILDNFLLIEMHQGNYDKAIGIGYQIIKINDDNSNLNDYVLGDVYFNMGLLFIRKNNQIKARFFLEKALTFSVKKNSLLADASIKRLLEFDYISPNTKNQIIDYLKVYNNRVYTY